MATMPRTRPARGLKRVTAATRTARGPRQLWLAALLVACRPAPPQPPSTSLRVHGCVTRDDAPAPDASVRLFAPDHTQSPVPLDADGCFHLERPATAMKGLRAVASGRGTTLLQLVPGAGEVDAEFALPAPGTFAAANIRSEDQASRLAAVASGYTAALRGKPTHAHLNAVARRWREESDATVRATLGLVYLVVARTPGVSAADIDVDLLRAAVAAVAPDHPAWGVDMESIILAERAGDIDVAYAQRVLTTHADPLVIGAAGLVVATRATEAGDPTTVRATLATLRTRKAAGPLADIAYTLDPDDLLAEGKPLPPFTLHRLAGDGVVDFIELRGKVVVLHIWATWCQPCIAQIPHLAALYTQHAAQGLEIVSLSIDEDAEAVVRFRRERQPMPWLHTWEPPDVAAQLRQRYQVTGSTKTILIGRDGQVLAEDLSPGHPQFTAQLTAALADPPTR